MLKWKGQKIFSQLEKRIQKNTKDALSDLVDKLKDAAPERVADGITLHNDQIVLSPEAAAVELGTKHMPPNPFVRRTISKEKDKLVETLRQP